jgi:hypothetical protein
MVTKQGEAVLIQWRPLRPSANHFQSWRLTSYKSVKYKKFPLPVKGVLIVAVGCKSKY